MSQITKTTYDFLKLVAKNNNRPWFQENKHLYEASHKEMIAFSESLYDLMKKHDNVLDVPPKKRLFRIYRDVRFSKDKSPYKKHWAGGIKRDTPYLRGGYYFHIEPGNSVVGAGFWNPNGNDIKLVRSHINADPSEITKINASKAIQETFGGIKGEKLKKNPRGIDPNPGAEEWIKHKQFLLHRKQTDQEVLDPNFASNLDEIFQKVRPFFDYMSEILTTDLNGESLI